VICILRSIHTNESMDMWYETVARIGSRSGEGQKRDNELLPLKSNRSAFGYLRISWLFLFDVSSALNITHSKHTSPNPYEYVSLS